jgi:C4-dicarboxylate-specific signal transduction histidine kinase
MKNFILSNEKNSEHNIKLAQALIDITQRIIGTLDYEKVLQIISDGISNLYEFETGAIYVLEGDDEIKLAVATPPLPPEMPDSLRKAKLSDHPTIENAILTKKPQVIADATTAMLSPAEREVVNMRNLRSIVYFPFIQKGKVLGVLILSTCNKNRTYTENEIKTGQGIADQLSVAIENALLHEDLRKHKENLEDLVIQRTQELENANEELHSINSDLREKHIIIQQQKEELEATLNNLKTTQTQLIQAEKMASLGILTSGVAHEINNPLNYIMGGYIGMKNFVNNKNLSSGELQKYFQSIETGIERITDIVKGLSEFGRSEDTINEDCDIHSIIDNSLVMLQHQIKDKIKITKDFTRNDTIVNGNSSNLHHIFLNILLNAIQSIENNGHIAIRTHAENGSIKVEIEDNGCGIHENDLPHVLDPFFTTKDPGKGTGLGLSIAHTNIKKMNGSINFISKQNKGTTVYLSFPDKD